MFVQLDGVSFPVAQWALRSGNLPNLRRWVDAGSHTLHEWTVQMPCTTPASQQAILQGSARGVPAFRWYDRALGRVLVANRPDDAAVIEERASTGRGLLADDGVSISNLFTGDAPRASMTMSRLEVARGSRRSREVFARFLLRPDGLARSLSRALAEVGRERFQAVRQRRLKIYPRVHRSWTFAGLRAFSNGLLRDLNTAVVADEMMRGTRSIYVDYVDYDEIAHHVGGTRLESLAALTGLDQVLGILERIAALAPRHYHLVVLSDHGQSQGEPFAARYGTALGDLCAELTHGATSGVEDNVEGWGRVDSVLEDLAGDHAGSKNVPQAASRRLGHHVQPSTRESEDELVVLGSGNLGLVYVPGRERMLLEDIERTWPALVDGLAQHPGVGFVAALAADGPVAIGPTGRHHLATGCVEGDDPMASSAPTQPRWSGPPTDMTEAPDLYVNSSVDPVNLEVAAFEPLVGLTVASAVGRTVPSCWPRASSSRPTYPSWAATSCTGTWPACSTSWAIARICPARRPRTSDGSRGGKERQHGGAGHGEAPAASGDHVPRALRQQVPGDPGPGSGHGHRLPVVHRAHPPADPGRRGAAHRQRGRGGARDHQPFPALRCQRRRGGVGVRALGVGQRQPAQPSAAPLLRRLADSEAAVDVPGLLAAAPAARGPRISQRSVGTGGAAGRDLTALPGRTLVRSLPFDWLLGLPLSAGASLVLWTSVPYLLLDRRIPWRRLLPGGALAGLSSSLYGVATTIYMPRLMETYSERYGLFGVTIALVSWLLCLSFIVVAATVVAAEFDRTPERWAQRLRAWLHLPAPQLPAG